MNLFKDKPPKLFWHADVVGMNKIDDEAAQHEKKLHTGVAKAQRLRKWVTKVFPNAPDRVVEMEENDKQGGKASSDLQRSQSSGSR